jgi:hypothetical protein
MSQIDGNKFRPAKHSPALRRIALMIATAAILFSTSGCGKNRVTGKVTLNGSPVKSGVVTFHGEGQRQNVANINADGEYMADNLPPGTYAVSVRSLPTNVMMGPMRLPHGVQPPLPTPAASEYIPRKYESSNSGLTFTVSSGAQQFDIALTP